MHSVCLKMVLLMDIKFRLPWPTTEQIPLWDQSVKWGKRDCQCHHSTSIPKLLILRLCFILLCFHPVLRINLSAIHLGPLRQGSDLGFLSCYNLLLQVPSSLKDGSVGSTNKGERDNREEASAHQITLASKRITKTMFTILNVTGEWGMA